jgi:hypothetical protein
MSQIGCNDVYLPANNIRITKLRRMGWREGVECEGAFRNQYKIWPEELNLRTTLGDPGIMGG